MNYYVIDHENLHALVMQIDSVHDSMATKAGKSSRQVMRAVIVKILNSQKHYEVGYKGNFYAHLCTPISEEEAFLELI
jgi:hypothetical protein